MEPSNSLKSSVESSKEITDCKFVKVSKMEFGSQHERKQMRRVTEFEDGKRLLPKPKARVELPFDVIVSILTRLPAIHLRRMRSVCRSWISQISDSRFIREYSKFRTNVTRRPYIVSLFCNFRLQYKMKVFPEGDDYHHEFDVPKDFVESIMSNSCDGLICIAGDVLTYLVNPSIQKVRALPKRSWNFDIGSAGLGFNDSTGEYKVVRLFHSEVGQHGDIRCEVYTVGNLHSPSCWKVVDSPPFEPFFHSLPIFVNGAIHWTIHNNGQEFWTFSNDGLEEVTPEIALSFDVKSEKFDVILHPEGSSRHPCSMVVELGGLLCLACIPHADEVQMDIWALKDYNNREWIKQYNIDLSAIYDHQAMLDYYWRTFFFMNIIMHDGKIVISDYGNSDYYDPQRKSFVKHVYRSIGGFAYNTAYTESIVWPMAMIAASPNFLSETAYRLG